ncbi:antibiotic biosynthesis monooxygenase [Frankia sp. AgKG'84/4]|nr:antibiotic biosynthesis monooxygenase [Frankia sp. AgKG'84/4]
MIGNVRVQPTRRDALVAAARQVVAAARQVVAASRGDEGCQSYGFYADLADENVIVGVETWRDQAALDAHMAHPHTQEFLAWTVDLLDGTPEMAFHQVPRICAGRYCYAAMAPARRALRLRLTSDHHWASRRPRDGGPGTRRPGRTAARGHADHRRLPGQVTRRQVTCQDAKRPDCELPDRESPDGERG